MLFGVAMPIVYIYFVLHLPMNLNVKWVLVLAFLLGFIVDIFADSPGVNSLSGTIMAVLRKPVFTLYSGNDEALAPAVPSVNSLGFAIFCKYLFTLTMLYCALCFTLDYFTFAHLGRMTLKIFSSTLLSSLILLGIDGLTGGKRM